MAEILQQPIRGIKNKAEKLLEKYNKNFEAIGWLIESEELNDEALKILEAKAEIYKIVINDLEHILYF